MTKISKFIFFGILGLIVAQDPNDTGGQTDGIQDRIEEEKPIGMGYYYIKFII